MENKQTINEKCWYKEVCLYRKCTGCLRFLEMNYLIEHSGIPLGHCIILGAPFILKWVVEFFEDIFRNKQFMKIVYKYDKKLNFSNF